MPVLKPDPKNMQMQVVVSTSDNSSDAEQHGAEGNSNNIAGAAEQARGGPDQPRLPTDMRGLLRFVMESTKAEDAPDGPSQFQPLDPERRQFLEGALNSMVCEPVEELKRQIEILNTIRDVADDPNADVEAHVVAFDHVVNFVGQIDLANDFHKIGGLGIFTPSLNSCHTSVQMAACDLLAELCQNNPYWQDVIVDTELFETLLELLKKDDNNQLSNKCLYAISCIVREHNGTYRRFLASDALNLYRDVLQRNADQQRSRAARLLTALCKADRDLPYRLSNLDYVPKIFAAIQTGTRGGPNGRYESNEQLVELLHVILGEYPLGLQTLAGLQDVNPVAILKRNVQQLKAALRAGEDRLDEGAQSADSGADMDTEESDATQSNDTAHESDTSGTGTDNTEYEDIANIGNLMDELRDNQEYAMTRRLIDLLEKP